jgi:hypothetical protein
MIFMGSKKTHSGRVKGNRRCASYVTHSLVEDPRPRGQKPRALRPWRLADVLYRRGAEGEPAHFALMLFSTLQR